MLTIVKAGYIIGEFMHLRYEVKFLIYAILLPMIFVVWLVGALITEGGSIFYGGIEILKTLNFDAWFYM